MSANAVAETKNAKREQESAALAVAAPGMGAVERAVAMGDLSKLSPDERLLYYRSVCESLGLNPLTQPFEYIVLDNKLRLYARKDCTEQLRSLRSITVEIVSQHIDEDTALIHVRATMPFGKGKRTDEDLGVVSLTGQKATARANAIMRAITKAKRRVTLSICGLGFLDETEIADVVPQVTEPQRPALPAPPPPAPLANIPPALSVEIILANDEHRKQINELLEACKIGDEEYLARLPAICGQADPAKLTAQQAEKVIKALRKRRDSQPEKVKVAS